MIERVLELYLKQGLSESEIARKFDVPVSTIEKILVQQGAYYGDY